MNELVVTKQYNLTSKGFLKAYIITMRPYLLFVSGITGMAGMSFTLNLSISTALLIFSASFLSYGFGQALTDCFQIDTDSISSPYRPLTQGIVSRLHFLSISIIGLLFCITVFTVFNPINLPLGLLSGFGLYTYTFFKKRWWGGPFYNSWIVSVLFIMAMLCGNSAVLYDHPKMLFALTVVFFGYANFVVAGYFKDVEADRATNYNTVIVVFGRKLSALVSDSFALISIVFTLLVLFITDARNHVSFIAPLMFLGAGIIHSIIGQKLLHKVKRDEESHKAISHTVHSYILLLSAITLIQKPQWAFFLIIFYGLFIITISLRPSESQGLGGAMIILLNPSAGGGTALKKWRSVKELIQAEQKDLDVIFMNRSVKTEGLIKSAIDNGNYQFVAAGGDGTLNYLLNTLLNLTAEEGIKKIKIGAVGIGSSNDFHKPFDERQKINDIPYKIDFRNAQYRDVGYIFYNERNTYIKKYFLINASIGITAEGNYLFNNPTKYLNRLKERNSNRAIKFTAVKTLINYKNQPVNVNSKESGSFGADLTNLGIVKNPNFSGNLSYGDSPIYNNGLLEIHLCTNMNVLDRLKLFRSLEKRNFNKTPKCDSWNTKELTITADKQFKIEYDGEVIITQYAKFGVLQKYLGMCQ